MAVPKTCAGPPAATVSTEPWAGLPMDGGPVCVRKAAGGFLSALHLPWGQQAQAGLPLNTGLRLRPQVLHGRSAEGQEPRSRWSDGSHALLHPKPGCRRVSVPACPC